jgi:hypothetical protein
MSEFLTQEIWPRLTGFVRKADNSQVAVAYLGKGASRLLPLKAGSTLIVDLSENAVKAGQTSPQEILKLIRRGVNVSSVGNLHAKVFVIGSRAFIGSANASFHSAQTLVEAMIETMEKTVVRNCRQFTQSLSGEIVTPEYAKRMQKLYRPPRFVRGHGSSGRSTLAHPSVWVVPLVFVDLDNEDERQEKIGIREARRMLGNSQRFEVKTFRWMGTGIEKLFKFGQMLIEVTREKRDRLMVSPPSRILSVRPYKKGRRSYCVVYVEARKKLREKNLRVIARQIGPLANQLKKRKKARLLRNRHLAHSLFQLWPE